MVHTYIDCTLPYPDAKVAGELAVGGPIKYVLKTGCGVSLHWIYKHVCPCIHRAFDDRVSNVLGQALLWAIFDPVMRVNLPSDLIDRVTTEYSYIRVLDEFVNPVTKICLIITGHEGRLCIDEFCEPEDDPISTGSLTSSGRSGQVVARDSKHMSAIYSKVQHLDRSHDEVLSSLKTRFSELTSQIRIVNNGIKNLGILPFVKTKNQTFAKLDISCIEHDPDQSTDNYKYSLSKRPKDLMTLWVEYQFGISGRAPAKDFTSVQRGKVKSQYHQRNLVWSCILRLTNQGHSAESSCEKIYQAYGESLSVTKIIKKMQEDNKSGGHPSLSG